MLADVVCPANTASTMKGFAQIKDDEMRKQLLAEHIAFSKSYKNSLKVKQDALEILEHKMMVYLI